jgi:hypothetical protein
MDEYNGPKTLIDEAGVEHPLPDYVKWLEEQVVSLSQSLNLARSTINQLRNNASSGSEYHRRRLRWEEDYLPYADDDHDR